MKILTHSFAVHQQQGFEVYILNNDEVELAVVPELGAKIVSLKNLRTGREWMWHPPGGLKLFRNHPGDDFSKSPLTGADECLPTISPCSWQGRTLPDHGELWNTAWSVETEAWASGILKTRTRLKISPFEFERTIELLADEIQITYQLKNRGAVPEHFLWAIHPLLQLQPGDQLNLPASTRALLNGESWIDAVGSTVPEKNCAKVFAAPVSEGFVAINNLATGDYLKFGWDPLENNTLGLWLTRGGWHGHHHFALEPMNADTDSLVEAVERKRSGVVDAFGTASWRLSVRIGA